jgi:hypothetical protein
MTRRDICRASVTCCTLDRTPPAPHLKENTVAPRAKLAAASETFAGSLGEFAMWLRLQFVPVVMLLLGAPLGVAEAAPVAIGNGALVRSSGSAEEVAAHCGRRGQGACRTLRGGPADRAYAPGDYYEHDANKLPFGSERWRDQMRRENRLGNPG